MVKASNLKISNIALSIGLHNGAQWAKGHKSWYQFIEAVKMLVYLILEF